jgi:hypothetical protein
MKKKIVKLPTERCDECTHTKMAFGFVSLGSEEGGPSRNLCPRCYNREYMKRAGLPELEPAEFDPVIRFDSVGKEHTFYLAVMMTTGLGIRATEWINGGPGGYQFFVLVHPQTPIREAYDKLIQKIETGMAQCYLRASDFPGEGAAQNRLYIDGTAVNGRISESDDGPTVVVDGREYSWEEFGRFLSPFTGFNFRLECFDASAEPETTPNPPRPDQLWWLEKEEGADGDGPNHH